MLRRAARQVTVPQAVVLAAAGILIVVAWAWTVLPGPVAVDELPPSAVQQLRVQADRVAVENRAHTSLGFGYSIDRYIGPTHQCAPTGLAMDNSHAIAAAIEGDPAAYPYLATRLDQSRERCIALRNQHARVAVLVFAAAVVAATAGYSVLRGRGALLLPTRGAFRSPVAVDAAATSSSSGGSDGDDAVTSTGSTPGASPIATGGRLRCRSCNREIGRRSPPVLGASATLCDGCIARTQQVPLFLLWSVSSLLVALSLLFISTGYGALAALVGVVGGLAPAFAAHIAIHESAHASAGLLMGARDVRVRMGSGPRIARAALGRNRIEVGLAPTSGLTIAPVLTPRLYRFREWSTVVAGPVATGAVIAAAWWLLPTALPWASVRWLVIGVGAFLLLGNLIPVRKVYGSQPVATDGAQLLSIPFLSRSEIDARIAKATGMRVFLGAETVPAFADITDADRDALERGARTGDPVLVVTWAMMASAGQDWPAMAAACRAAIAADRSVVPAGLRTLFQNNLAWSLVMLDQVERGGEADLASGEAIAADSDNPAIRGTRCEVLALTGRIAEARAMAAEHVDEAWTPDGEPRWEGDAPPYARERHLTSAVVETCAGNLDLARAAIAEAERHGADTARVARVRRLVAERADQASAGLT